ncbi:spermatogenesis-associated protein 7 homolog [Engraulis encrasicolus]|uniref:spermatogenesis-associated protein 7 homolog n=1 Tax=Engraulis encrasicolus TaxID=184585 RepID=UPI002FD247F4
MGFIRNATMDAKKAYCPGGSSGNLTKQYLIQDHMFAHYRKVFTAKAAVDTSAPKALQSSIKYSDQRRRERLKRESSRRSSSSRSLRSGFDDTRDSCSSKASRTSLQDDEDGCHYTGGSTTSSPRPNTSFHVRQVVYPSHRAATAGGGGGGSSRNLLRSASEISFRPATTLNLHRQQSLRCAFGPGLGPGPGPGTSGGQGSFKAFQDPVQKTYSGDLMVKHSQCFTPEKPFTPRTLKKDTKSQLAQYRFYTPPRRKPPEEKISPLLVLQDSNPTVSTTKRTLSTEWDLPETFDLESELLDDCRKQNKVDKTTSSAFLSSARMSPDGTKSPIMKKVNTEEEELLYLEFIADVTNEILTLGLYSDRVMKRVFQRHIDNNKHRLDEGKMRHLLEILHHDIQSPSNTSTLCVHSTKKEEEDLFSFSEFHLDVSSKTKFGDRPSTSSSAMFDRDFDQRWQANPMSVSTPLLRSPTNVSYRHGLDAEDGPTRHSYSSRGLKREKTEKGPSHFDRTTYTSQFRDQQSKMGRLKVVPSRYSSHDIDTEEESLRFDLSNYGSRVLDGCAGDGTLESSPPNYSSRDRELEDLLRFSPTSLTSGGPDAGVEHAPLRRSSTSYSSHGQDGRTEDGSLRRPSTGYSAHGPDAETRDDPQRGSPISYSPPHGSNDEAEDGQSKKSQEDYLSSGTEHGRLTPEEHETNRNELSAELEELGANMESLHVSQTPSEPEGIKDEQAYSVFSDDEF